MTERTGPFAPARVHGWPESLLLFAVATFGEFFALVSWFLLDAAHRWFVAAVALLVGFAIERGVVVLWLNLPRRLRTPFGAVRPLWLIVFGVTVAEIAVWFAWIRLAEAEWTVIGALVLLIGIHVVHAYEVALIRQDSIASALADPGTIVLTGLETLGGIIWLHFAADGAFARGAAALMLALLVEHILQVVGFKKGVKKNVPAAAPQDVDRPQIA
jgi:hypothetical protein